MTQTPEERSTSPEPYRTSDSPYAAYLHLRGHRIVGTKQDPNDYKREVVVFIMDEEIPQLEQEWRFGKPEGNLKQFHRSLKIVNRTVNEARNARKQ